jgi:hypothetical protein
MDRSTKRALWVVAGVVVFIALVLHHNITSDEIIFFCVIVPSIILHEVSHGWVARAFGDDTAARAGRLTLNPLVHVDPVGTLIVPALLALGGFGVFGWAKPVPVNTARLRSPRNQGVLVSWPDRSPTLVLAVIGAFVFVAVFRTTFNASFNPSVLSRDRLLLQRGQHRPDGLQPDPAPAARRFGALRAGSCPALLARYLRIRPYTMLIVVGLVPYHLYNCASSFYCQQPEVGHRQAPHHGHLPPLQLVARRGGDVVGSNSSRRAGTVGKPTRMVGDDIGSDVLGAQEAGITGVLVRTGVHRTSKALDPAPTT